MRVREPVWPVASALVGAVVGAGFASGREIHQFFGIYGRDGLWGAVLAGLGLGLLATVLLERGRRRRAVDYRDLFPRRAGRAAGWADLVLAFGLWAGLGVVLAGGGAMAGGRGHWEGLLVMGGSLFLVLWRGERLFLKVNSLLVPFFLLAGFGLWLGMGRSSPTPLPRGGFYWGAILFLAYNSLLSLGVLAPLGRRFGTAFGTLAAGLLAGGSLGLLALGLAMVNLGLGEEAAREPLPLLHAAERLSPAFGRLYAAALWAAMFTTGLGNGFALRERFRSFGLGPAAAALLPILLAAPLGALGLVSLVERLYPVLGAASLLTLGWILWPDG